MQQPLSTKLYNRESTMKFFHKNTTINIRFKLIMGTDRLFYNAYSALEQQFDPATMDPISRYIEWLDWNEKKKHPFPYIMVVAYDPKVEKVYGVISGNIMILKQREAQNDNNEPKTYIFAVGHQVTIPEARGLKPYGIGQSLLNYSFSVVSNYIDELGGTFSYTVLEAEKDSIGFWTKMGFKWPNNVRYWQPPLLFDIDGKPVHLEVEETLLLRIMANNNATYIYKKDIKKIITALFWNWSLFKYKTELSEEAFSNAENYVNNLFQKICKTLPSINKVEIIPINS